MRNAEHHVVVIGAAVLDTKVYAAAPMVEPARSNPGQILTGWGGVARNMAENLVRLGVDVSLVTAVGDDPWGRALLEHLRALEIDTSAVLLSEDKPTAAFAGLYHADRRMWVAFEAMDVLQEISPGYLHRLRGLIRDADMVCVDANLSARAFETLFRLTSQYGIPVCASPTTPLLSHRLHPYLPEITAITPDRDEAEALVGFDLTDDAAISQATRRMVQLGVDLAIVTLGADGLFYATSEEHGRIPPLAIAVVNPVGAGDALTAGIAYGLLEGVSPEEAVRLGSAAAAQTMLCNETVCPTLSLESLFGHWPL